MKNIPKQTKTQTKNNKLVQIDSILKDKINI